MTQKELREEITQAVRNGVDFANISDKDGARVIMSGVTPNLAIGKAIDSIEALFTQHTAQVRMEEQIKTEQVRRETLEGFVEWHNEIIEQLPEGDMFDRSFKRVRFIPRDKVSAYLNQSKEEDPTRILLSKQAIEALPFKEVSADELQAVMCSWSFNPILYYPKDLAQGKNEKGYDGKYRYLLLESKEEGEGE